MEKIKLEMFKEPRELKELKDLRTLTHAKYPVERSP
jgi:hypothetical protein